MRIKIVAFIICFALVHASARTLAQISLHEKNVPLQKVLKDIERQSSYTFLYKSNDIDPVKNISVDVSNASLEQVLNACLKDLPLDYKIADQTVLIKKKETSAASAQLAPVSASPPEEIAGTVKNKAGEPLTGATVRIKRNGYGAVTDARGSFVLKGVLPTDTLVISFIGYSPKVLSIHGTVGIENPQGITEYNITLQETTNPLDEVVVLAYGETSQRLATGDIGTLSAKDIENNTNMNPLLDLQGRIAGVDVTPTSGYASGPVNITIRGLTSVTGQVVDPLYVVDGVPLTVVQVGQAQNASTGSAGFLQNGLGGPANGQSPLFSIDPSDIESISILKDADATSIYGSRGANGVVLITTKKGKAGKTKFDVHVDEGYSEVTKYYQLLSTAQYLEMREEGFHNDGITPTDANAPDLLLWSPTAYTNWQKELWGKVASNNNTTMSLSGGDAQTTFRIAGSYNRQNEITSASGSDQRAAVSFNLTHRALDDKFSVSFTSQYSFAQSNMIGLPGHITYAPNAPSIYNADGSLNWVGWETAGGNPFGSLLEPYSSKTNFLNSNLTIRYQILRGLSFTTSFGYNVAQANQTQLIPIASQNPAGNPTGTSIFGNNSNKNWLVEPQLTYNTQIWKGKFNVLIGGSVQGNTTDGIYLYGSGYTNDALLRTISNAPTQVASDNYGEYRYASIFGRIGYNIEDKYIVDFNVRRDGSSNYGPGNQYGNFASAGAAWLFSNEDWFKKLNSFLSLGKLRASYGTAGSDGGIPYGYLTRWSSNSLVSYDGIQPLIPTQHANPNYQWQTNRQLELATDLGFFKDWVTASIVYYDKKTDNELLNYPTPEFSGFSTVLENLPALVENKGWEFTIGGKGVNTEYFQWAPSFNFSINQNKFVSFPGLGGASNYFKNGIVGHPLDGIYVLHYTGVNPQTGQYTFEDYNHDGRIIEKPISQGGDEYFKKLGPSFFTGFGFNTGFKGLKLSLFFSVKKQTGINALAQGSNAPGAFQYGVANEPIQVLNRWQYPGQITNTGKFSTISAADPNYDLSDSDIGYTDASYIRLQNASLSYSLPGTLTKKMGMSSCSLFIHANDLLTITGYKGIDPDVQTFGALPPVRTIVGGISVGF